MKIEIYLSYPPHYHYRQVISKDPTIHHAKNESELDDIFQSFLDEFKTSSRVILELKPHILDNDQTNPEFILLQGDRLKNTAVHFRITPDAPANEPPVD